MKMHKIELYVVDFEDYGIDSFITEIEQLDISACVHCKNERTVDIGDWHDYHIVNRRNVTHEQLEMFFKNILSVEGVFNRQLALLRGDSDAKHFQQWLDVFYDHDVLDEELRDNYIKKCEPFLDIHHPLDANVLAARDEWFKKHLNIIKTKMDQ